MLNIPDADAVIENLKDKQKAVEITRVEEAFTGCTQEHIVEHGIVVDAISHPEVIDALSDKGYVSENIEDNQTRISVKQ